MSEIRSTKALLQVVQVFLNEPTEQFSGVDLTARTRLPVGTLYPLLKRMEDAAWLESEWEAVDLSVVRRPRKRFYRITGLGMRKAKAALHEAFPLVSGGLEWNTVS